MKLIICITIIVGGLLTWLANTMASGGESEQMFPFELIPAFLTIAAVIVEFIVWAFV